MGKFSCLSVQLIRKFIVYELTQSLLRMKKLWRITQEWTIICGNNLIISLRYVLYVNRFK